MADYEARRTLTESADEPHRTCGSRERDGALGGKAFMTVANEARSAAAVTKSADQIYENLGS